MKALYYFVWSLVVLVPLVFLGLDHSRQGRERDAPSATDKPGRVLPRGGQEGSSRVLREERRSLDHLRGLLMEGASIVKLQEFENRLLRANPGFNPNSRNYRDLLLSAYLNAILRYEMETGHAAHYAAVAEVFGESGLAIDRHLVTAAAVYGLEKALALTGGVESLSEKQLNSFVAGVKSEIQGDLARMILAKGMAGKLEGTAIETLLKANPATLPTALKWELLGELPAGGEERDIGLRSMARFLAGEAAGTQLPHFPIENKNELRQFQSAYVLELLARDDALGVRCLADNEDLLGDEMRMQLAEAAVQMGEADLPRLSRLADGTESKGIAAALRHGQLKAWSAYAPAEAARYAYQGLQSGSLGLEHLATAMQDWFTLAPTNAADFLKTLALSEKQRSDLMDPYLPEIARNAPEYYQSYLATRSAESFWENRNYKIQADLEVSEQHALQQIDRIASPTDRFTGYVNASRLIASRDLEKAIGFAAKTTDPDKRDALLMGLIPEATNADLQLSQQLIGRISNPQAQHESYRTWYNDAMNKEPGLAVDFIDAARTTNPQLYQYILNLNP